MPGKNGRCLVWIAICLNTNTLYSTSYHGQGSREQCQPEHLILHIIPWPGEQGAVSTSHAPQFIPEHSFIPVAIYRNIRSDRAKINELPLGSKPQDLTAHRGSEALTSYRVVGAIQEEILLPLRDWWARWNVYRNNVVFEGFFFFSPCQLFN